MGLKKTESNNEMEMKLGFKDERHADHIMKKAMVIMFSK